MQTAPPTDAESYWGAKPDVMQLIGFPLGEDRPVTELEEAIYGLDHVDTERLLQVSPPVRGREMPEYPQARNISSESRTSGTSPEEFRKKRSADWANSGGSNKGSGKKTSSPQQASSKVFGETDEPSERSSPMK